LEGRFYLTAYFFHSKQRISALQRLLPVVLRSQIDAEMMSGLSRETVLVRRDVRSGVAQATLKRAPREFPAERPLSPILNG
jgi:hypothetical protein